MLGDEQQDQQQVVMSKAVIVSPDIPTTTGGIGSFTWNLAKLLRMGGHEVLVVVAQPLAAAVATAPWRKLCVAEGIATATIDSATFSVPVGYSSRQRIAECVTELIPDDADVVYLADWLATGVHLVRTARYRRQPGPALVTVLHGCAQWVREGMRVFPSSREDLELDALEAYAACHSDYVVAPGAYMRAWTQEAGWKLPADSHTRVLPLPFLPSTMTCEAGGTNVAAPLATSAPMSFRRIVFFGRLETRKGIELFVSALGKLSGHPCLRGIEEIVLLGGAAPNAYGAPEAVAAELARRLHSAIAVRTLSALDTFQAQAYLTEHAADSLVVMPSLRENFPLAVIEASLIPGLNLLASGAGSIGEILGPQGREQLFEPFLAPFAQRLEATLLAGPKPDAARGHYAWQSANAGWIAFHDEVVACARARRQAALALTRQNMATENGQDSDTSTALLRAPETVDRSVDVCIPYYNLGAYLPSMLESLERQTVRDFNVIVVNDGSTDPASIRVFEEQAARYSAERGWRFITTPNGGPCAARNAGAAAATGRYLIFVDADDVAAPTLVEHFRDAIEVCGDDCLSAYLGLFHGEGWDEAYTQSLFDRYMPVGPDPALGLISNPFGGACFIVRREAFERVAGFSTDVSRYVGYEDYAFFLKLLFAGHTLDVLPELLLYYRVRDGGNFRTGDQFENQLRIVRMYDERLQQAGLPGLAAFAVGAFEAANSDAKRVGTDIPSLVYHVSGHVLWKAMRIKVRNQIAKRLGRALIDH